MSSVFVCPECKNDLEEKDSRYYCTKCPQAWDVRDGIPVFLSQATPYWSELPREKAVQLNEMAESTGWHAAIQKFFPEELQHFVLDDSRINWKYTVESNTAGRVLDAGSGWGTLAFALARDGAEVYAFEPIWERIRFIDIRCRQDDVGNLIPVCGDLLHLPFPDNLFDLVILNGVVEWLGLSDMSVRAGEVQKRVLKDILRILKPGGSVYIGIENRFAYFYFLGKKDPHSGLRFVNLMPRRAADIYSGLVKKQKYRTYIYSLNGYRDLLDKAGFTKIDFYTPLPGYLNFKYLIPLGRKQAMVYWLNNLISERLLFAPFVFRLLFSVVRLLFKTPLAGIAGYFVPDFSIVAVKKKNS